MSSTILIILQVILIFSIGVLFGYKFIRPKKITESEILKMTIKNMKFINKLNPFVLLVYKAFIDRYNAKNFQLSEYTLYIKDIDIVVWSANSTSNRFFHRISDDLLRKHNTTLTKVNKSLTILDKEILEEIIQRIHHNNVDFANRVFINKELIK